MANKGKSRVYTGFGRKNYHYIDKKQRFTGVILLILSMILSYGIKVYYEPTEELLSPIPDGYVFVVRAAEPTPEPTPIPEPKFAKVTAYSCGGLTTAAEVNMNCPSLKSGSPKTADGTTPVPYKTMACDKANMGRTFDLKGIGTVKCTDTGGAINGAGRFDLYVETVDEAYKFGVQSIEYELVQES